MQLNTCGGFIRVLILVLLLNWSETFTILSISLRAGNVLYPLIGGVCSN